MSKTTDVLKRIENARENGDFDLVKRLSKRALENPQSDINPVLIMDQIAHMHLDNFLVWVNEMKKIDSSVNKHDVLCKISQDLKDNPDKLLWYTQYMKEMIETDKGNTINNENKKYFIGHGGSLEWLKLKDFFKNTLKLPYEEFNCIPQAGNITGIRLKEMLESCCMAFLIMTGEDEHTDGTLHARENVIHEIGLFQAQLGYEKAIILLEEGCKIFSNIQGITYISFPKGNIKAAFEDIRNVLKREFMLE